MSGIALGYLIFSILFWVWSAVGIWRSAYWHRRRGGAAGWGVAARVLVLLGFVASLLRSQDYALQAAEFASLAMGRDRIGATAEMKIMDEGRVLHLNGPIALGTADKFRTTLEAAPGLREILLTSTGGRMFEAERMAALIRERKLDTRVDDFCMSACISLLLAGEQRIAPHTAQVGFHQPSFPGMSAAQLRVEVEDVRRQYIDAGVDRAFLRRALAYPAESMWFPTWHELLAANVVTEREILVQSSGAGEAHPAGVDPDSLTGKRLQRNLARQADATNKAGPRALDAHTTLKTARAEGLSLTLNYTVTFDRVDVGQARRAVTSPLRRQLCGQIETYAAIMDGATFLHAYHNTAGRHLFTVSISDCG